MNIIPFNMNAPAPVRTGTRRVINTDVAMGRSYPTLSIKGKVFTLAMPDGKRTLLSNQSGAPVQFIDLVFLRINGKARAYYNKAFTEGETLAPTCHSQDGVDPDSSIAEPQGTSCAACPHSKFGTAKNPDGTFREGCACAQRMYVAVAFPTRLDVPVLLNVPPASRSNKETRTGLRDLIRALEARGAQYNEVLVRVSFDFKESAPVLTFEAVGYLPDDLYNAAAELYDSKDVLEIVGARTEEAVAAGPVRELPTPSAPAIQPPPVIDLPPPVAPSVVSAPPPSSPPITQPAATAKRGRPAATTTKVQAIIPPTPPAPTPLSGLAEDIAALLVAGPE